MVRPALRPSVESLSDRICPVLSASTDSFGDLMVQGVATGPVNFQMVNNNQFTITENAVPLGTFGTNGSVTVKLGSNIDTVNWFMDDGAVSYLLSGNLSIDTGGGDDVVTITGASTGPAVGGTIMGRVNLTNVNEATFDTVSVGSDLTIQNTAENSPSIKAYDLLATIIGGNFTARTGTANETVTLGANSFVGGYVNLTLGNGNNIVVFEAGTLVGGNVTILDGSGNDGVTFMGDIGGNVNLSLGSSVTTNSFTFAAGANIAGNLSLVSGPTSNTSVFFDGILYGNANFQMGSGLAFGNTLMMGAGSAILGSSFNYTGGAGVDIVTLDGDFHQTKLTANLGGSADNFTLNGNGNLTSVYIDFGAGVDTYSTSLSPYIFPTTLRNLP